MLVADALDAMAAETATQQRGTLQRFGGDDLDLRIARAEVVAGGDSAATAGGGNVGRQPQSTGGQATSGTRLGTVEC